jgi:GT2 family glycosyltransferase
MTDTAVMMVTHENPDQTARTIKLLERTSDCDYDLFVVDSGSGPVMQKSLQELATDGLIKWLRLSEENIGLNNGLNMALDEIMEHNEYDWIVLWSPDVEPKGRRALKKLVRAARMFKVAGADVLASPRVSGAPRPTPLTATGDDVGFPYFAAEIIRGYARVHPRKFFNGFRYNSYGALALGESAETCDRANELEFARVVIENIKVKHVGGDTAFPGKYIGYGL